MGEHAADIRINCAPVSKSVLFRPALFKKWSTSPSIQLNTNNGRGSNIAVSRGSTRALLHEIHPVAGETEWFVLQAVHSTADGMLVMLAALR